MSTSEFGFNKDPHWSDKSDSLPIDEKIVQGLSEQVDNALNLPGGSVSISRTVNLNINGLGVSLEVTQDFEKLGSSGPNMQLEMYIFPNSIDYEDEEESDLASEDGAVQEDEETESRYIQIVYDMVKGIGLDINGDTDHEARSSAGLCLLAGQIVRAHIHSHATPSFWADPEVLGQFDAARALFLQILNTDKKIAFDIVNTFNVPYETRNKALTKETKDIMEILRKTRMGDLLTSTRAHLSLEDESDTTLSLHTQTEFQDDRGETCVYRRILTPSGLGLFCEGETLYRSKSHFAITEEDLVPLIVTEEIPECTTTSSPDFDDTDSSSLPYSEVIIPRPSVITRLAKQGDFLRIRSEMAELHQKYGI